MKTSGIYHIKNLITGKIYIGLSTDIEHRFFFHKRRLLSNKHKNKHLQSSFNTHGVDAFEFKIVEECDDSVLCEREKYWIAHHKSYDRDFGYNKTHGGEFGRMSDEIVQRTAAILRTKTIPQEMRDRISKTLSGKTRPDRNRFDRDTELIIIEAVTVNQIGIRTIATKYNASTCAIYNVLKRNNIEWKKK